MADKKISALTAATTPLDGTEVLPIVQGGATVKVANNDLRPKQIQSNATSGVLQVAGPAAASTRVMTTPDANFSAARIDAGQTFFGIQRFANNTDNDASIDIYGATTGGDPYIKGYDRNGATNFEFICDTATTDRRFDYYGKVRVYNSNFVVGTSGNGIDFSATAGTGTSELLADYEEGTWTPDLLISGGNTGITGTQTGKYTKIGRVVTVEMSITLTSKGARTGAVRVGGLPYTGAIDPAVATIVPTGTWALLTAGGSIQAYVSGSAMYLLLGSITGTTSLTDANLSNTSAFTAMATFSV